MRASSDVYHTFAATNSSFMNLSWLPRIPEVCTYRVGSVLRRLVCAFSLRSARVDHMGSPVADSSSGNPLEIRHQHGRTKTSTDFGPASINFDPSLPKID